MSWRDQLQDASFRGVPFKVLTASTEVGRRTILHQYPFNDVPYAEDMGKAAGMFNVTGYVLQNAENDYNYFEERDALIDALNKSGAGTLVHPWRGPLKVVLTGRARVEESFREGGIARFTLTFVEAGNVQVPGGVIAPESEASAAADTVKQVAGDTFEEEYNPGLLTLLDDVLAFVDMAQGAIYKVQSVATAKVSEALTKIAGVRDDIEQIIEAPTQLREAIDSTFDTYEGLISDASGVTLVSSLLEFADYGVTDTAEKSMYGSVLEPIPSLTTETRKQQANNRTHFMNFVRATALAEAVRAAANVVYEDYDDVYETLTNIMAAIEEVAEELSSDGKSDIVLAELFKLIPKVVGILLLKGAAAPVTLYRTVPSEPKPSVVWARELYDDLSRESEIINRNPFVMLHPGFPAGGEQLEVVSE